MRQSLEPWVRQRRTISFSEEDVVHISARWSIYTGIFCFTIVDLPTKESVVLFCTLPKLGKVQNSTTDSKTCHSGLLEFYHCSVVVAVNITMCS